MNKKFVYQVGNNKKAMCSSDGYLLVSLYKGKGKGTVHPRTSHEGTEGEQRYSCTLSLTSALDGSGWSTPRPGRFPPGKDPVPLV